jgi:thiamine biosynthesis protein ThiS
MKLHINGEAREFDGSLSLAALIEHLGMKQDRVAVERNRDIVPREQWDATNLAEDDQLEIVHFVGGGALGLSQLRTGN